ncbi:Glyoxalase/Bleomycin resistance protein/Dihydroxybiphenyl dioxygenase [Hypoxylon fragiforme]|uniref:Glyoxalase/Bleomycin resistance protein/Dihydroxybiphenyl dioxygenase n=1 Tax=Hypoxylon fragiforme TaxID=63214 RepID=UPI0020C6F09A|nr:Glyoxalase/Bleomycin resistance protein/Dihydroxybiphenyl dioxygenase [Hypoxylon fragiforme]KAI2605379.1 Glyoxalase/Bleomycin resistance protein/Dihydroxybiphenyl dioxygenase [Hypoxylon fragiforme]
MSTPGASQGPVLRPATLAHVFLRTNKFPEMVAWYKAVLGAEARLESDRISFLCFDAEHHRVAICALPDTGDKIKTGAGLEHMAFGFASLDDLALAYQQRKARGITPSWCVNHGITMPIYYSDADGNMVETQADSFDSNEEATAYMLSEEFKENPVGTEVDPEELVRRLQAGEDRAEIRKRDGPCAGAPKG